MIVYSLEKVKLKGVISMKKINGILLMFFILTGCAATSYEGQQTRGNGLDMNLVAILF